MPMQMPQLPVHTMQMLQQLLPEPESAPQDPMTGVEATAARPPDDRNPQAASSSQ